MPDNVVEQTPRIFGGFGTFGTFEGNQNDMQKEARLRDNVFEQTPRICGIGHERQSQELRFLKKYISLRACINRR